MYTVSDYLVDIMEFLGAKDVFGVPGDYNLDFLDHIENHNNVNWVGNMNELNAAYMADGFAKKNGFAALVTTFGVGDLSADNGLAGSLAENVPVLSIVGAPNTQNMNKKLLVHHTFGDGRFDQFTKMHEVMGMKTKDLTFDNTINDINEIVQYIIETGKPAYMTLPIDVAKMSVNPELKNNFSTLFTRKLDATEFNKQVVSVMMEKINAAKNPVVLVGHEVKHKQLSSFAEAFITNNKIAFTDLAFGKSAIDESLPQFIGTYNGEFTEEHAKEIVDNADLIINLGAKLTDFVTAMFSQSFDDTKMVELNNHDFKIFGSHAGLNGEYSFNQAMAELAKQTMTTSPNFTFNHTNDYSVTPTDKPLNQDFYDKAIINSVQPGQTLIAESGTSFSGLSVLTLPENVDFTAQPLWASIGYAFPAMIGSQFADRNSRHILATGEGSLQLTIQEFATLIKHDLKPIVIILENNGYTVERLIHGMDAKYNDVAKLDYTKMPEAFGASSDQFETMDVSTEQEFADALAKAQADTDKLVVIQAHMAFNDAPGALNEMGKIIEKKND